MKAEAEMKNMDTDGFLDGARAPEIPSGLPTDGWEIIFTEAAPVFSWAGSAVNGRQAVREAVGKLVEREGEGSILNRLTEALVRLKTGDGFVRWEALVPLYFVSGADVIPDVEPEPPAAPRYPAPVEFLVRCSIPRGYGAVTARSAEDAALSLFVGKSLDAWWRGRYTDASPSLTVMGPEGDAEIVITEEMVRSWKAREAPREDLTEWTASLGKAFVTHFVGVDPEEAAVSLVREHYPDILLMLPEGVAHRVRVEVTAGDDGPKKVFLVSMGEDREGVAVLPEPRTEEGSLASLPDVAAGFQKAVEAVKDIPRRIRDAVSRADEIANATESEDSIAVTKFKDEGVSEIIEEDPEHGIGNPEPVADQGRTVLYHVEAVYGDGITRSHVEAAQNEFHAAVDLLTRFPSIPLTEVDRVNVHLVDPETGDLSADMDVVRQERLGRVSKMARERRNPGGGTNQVDPAISEAARSVPDEKVAEFLREHTTILRGPRVEALVMPTTRDKSEETIDGGGGRTSVKPEE